MTITNYGRGAGAGGAPPSVCERFFVSVVLLPSPPSGKWTPLLTQQLPATTHTTTRTGPHTLRPTETNRTETPQSTWDEKGEDGGVGRSHGSGRRTAGGEILLNVEFPPGTKLGFLSIELTVFPSSIFDLSTRKEEPEDRVWAGLKLRRTIWQT